MRPKGSGQSLSTRARALKGRGGTFWNLEPKNATSKGLTTVAVVLEMPTRWSVLLWALVWLRATSFSPAHCLRHFRVAPLPNRIGQRGEGVAGTEGLRVDYAGD